jgi:chromosome segregation ATPase
LRLSSVSAQYEAMTEHQRSATAHASNLSAQLEVMTVSHNNIVSTMELRLVEIQREQLAIASRHDIEVADLKRHVEAQTQNSEEARAVLAEVRKEVITLSADNTKIMTDYNLLTAKHERLVEGTSSLSNDFIQANTHVATLTRELAAEREALRELNQTFLALRSDLGDTTAELAKAVSAARAAEESSHTWQEKHGNVVNEVQAAKTAVATLESEVDYLQRRMEQSIVEHKLQILASSEQLAAAQQKAVNLTVELSNNKLSFDDLARMRDAESEKYANLVAEHNSLHDRFSNLNAQYEADTRSWQQKADTESKRLAALLGEWQTEKNDLSQHIHLLETGGEESAAELSKDLSLANAEKVAIQHELHEANAQLASARAETSEWRLQLNGVQERLHTFQSQCSELNVSLRRVQEENTTLQSRIVLAEQKAFASSQSTQLLEAQVKKQNDWVAESESKFSELLQQSQEQNENLRAQVSRAMHDRDISTAQHIAQARVLDESCSSLSLQLQSATARLEKLQSRHDTLVKEHNEKAGQLALATSEVRKLNADHDALQVANQLALSAEKVQLGDLRVVYEDLLSRHEEQTTKLLNLSSEHSALSATQRETALRLSSVSAQYEAMTEHQRSATAHASNLSAQLEAMTASNHKLESELKAVLEAKTLLESNSLHDLATISSRYDSELCALKKQLDTKTFDFQVLEKSSDELLADQQTRHCSEIARLNQASAILQSRIDSLEAAVLQSSNPFSDPLLPPLAPIALVVQVFLLIHSGVKCFLYVSLPGKSGATSTTSQSIIYALTE